MTVTATVTKDIQKEVIARLEMKGFRYVFRSPNKPKVMYCNRVQRRTTLEKDLGHILAIIPPRKTRPTTQKYINQGMALVQAFMNSQNVLFANFIGHV